MGTEDNAGPEKGNDSVGAPNEQGKLDFYYEHDIGSVDSEGKNNNIDENGNFIRPEDRNEVKIKEYMNHLKLGKALPYTNSENFKGFLSKAATLVNKLEGTLIFKEVGGDSSGTDKEVQRNYFAGEPFNEIIYSVSGKHSNQEILAGDVLNTMKANLKNILRDKGYVSFDGDKFSIDFYSNLEE